MADYSTFRYDFKRSGSTLYSVTDNLVKLSTSPNVGVIRNSPAIDQDGNIYAAIWNGGLVAFNKDGQRLWSSGTFEPSGTPAFDNDGNIYFATSGTNPYVYSFTKSGQKRWGYDLRQNQGFSGSNQSNSAVTLSPNKDTLYVTVDYPFQGIKAFNLDGTVKWEQRFWYSPNFSSIAVADDGTLYVGTSGYGKFFSLTPNGIIKWTGYGGNQINTPLVGSDGNIYAAANGNFDGTSSVISYTATGQSRWTYKQPGGFVSELVFKDNTVYAVSGNKVLAINSINGSLKWAWQAPIAGTINSSPSVDNNGVTFVSMNNILYSIDPAGQEKWHIGVANYVSQPIIFDNNKILLYSRDDAGGYFHILGKLQPTKTPVIFIPGIGGSELKVKNDTVWSKDDGHGGTYNHTYNAGEKVWVNEPEGRALGNDDYFDVLRIKGDGQTEEATLEKTGIMYEGAYGEIIPFFQLAGYHLGKDLFIYNYDWRKDVSITSSSLDQLVEEAKQKSGSQKVNIVAHSLGGLISRNYILDQNKAQKINQLITLGTPNLGTPFFLKSLMYGNCLTKAWLNSLNIPYCIGLTDSEMKDVIQNMISGYELAPSQKYYEFYNGADNNHPLPFVDNRDIDNNGVTGFLNYSQIKTLLTNLGHNTTLFTPAEAFHNLDNNLPNLNGVDISIIAGSGQATTGQIIEDYYLNFLGIKIPKTDIRKINGDDTVPLFSASLTDGVKSIVGSAKVYYTNQQHGSLVFNGPAMNLVKNILNSDNNLPAGISTTPYPFTGTGLSVHSPVLIHAYDQNGKHTGPLPNGDYEANIPGSSYETLGDAKFIWLPDSGIYNLKFEATDNGSFDFKIRDYKNDINDKTTLYKDVPLTTNTKAETVFDTNSSTPPILQVDRDGNGTVDSQVSPTSNLTGDAVYDQTPPKTTVKLVGTIGNNNWYKSDVLVELSADDPASGSGILKTAYSLDNGQTIQTYTNPFTISTEGINKLKVKSIDNAGNEENPQEIEIKIDKTAPEVKISFNIQTQSLEVAGTDNLTNVSVVESDAADILTDEAGNTTKLQFKPSENDEEKEKDKEKKQEKKKRDTLELKDISYNNNPAIKFSENEFNIKFDLDKKINNIKEFKQELDIEKQIEIETNYNLKKNVTSIETKRQKDKKQKEERAGVVIIYLSTNKGSLEVKF